MKLCPSCGNKDFDRTHRGTFSRETCANCGGNAMKKMPMMNDKDGDEKKPPYIPKGVKPPVKKAPLKGKKKDMLYGC
jgi:rRNA maturation protein Nop10